MPEHDDEFEHPRRVSLRDEHFTDAEGNQHNRLVDAEDLAPFCDFDNKTWPCPAAADTGSEGAPDA